MKHAYDNGVEIGGLSVGRKVVQTTWVMSE